MKQAQTHKSQFFYLN
jgi:hypothetical protein